MSSAKPLVSIIIPTWCEESTLGRCLESVHAGEPPFEIIVSDCDSPDETRAVAEGFADVQFTRSPVRGRGAQMNHAARLAAGPILWFLHADSIAAPGATRAIRAALTDARVVGGSFRFQVESPRPVFRWIERAVHLRTRWLRSPYGDQGIFVRREIFDRTGGYPAEPILEDLNFVRAIRREGKLATLDLPLRTSARRWQEAGVLRTTLRHQRILALEKLGVPPERLAGSR